MRLPHASQRAASTLLTAIETARTLPTNRTVLTHSKIVYVMEGSARIETAQGVQRLTSGMSLALGQRRWCRIIPVTNVRLWTVHVREDFLLTQMSFYLPDETRVRFGVHPRTWDGNAVVLDPGIGALRKIEPLWRELSVLQGKKYPPERLAVRTIELFNRCVDLLLPALLITEPHSVEWTSWRPVTGHLTDSTTVGQLGKAVTHLRERMEEPWSVSRLAREVSLSRTHLARLFVTHTGVAPMRFLTEVRLTEFTRLVEETDLSVSQAARTVGWSDARIASAWFYRRFGIRPSRYRSIPHPYRENQVLSGPFDADTDGTTGSRPHNEVQGNRSTS